MNDLELCAWTLFVDMVKNLLGNQQTKNYKEIVAKLLKNLQDIGANIRIKFHFLHDHLHKFPDNYSDVSDDQGERFHQDIKTMEECYQGQWDKRMMADYCSSIKRDFNIKHDRQSRKRKFLL